MWRHFEGYMNISFLISLSPPSVGIHSDIFSPELNVFIIISKLQFADSSILPILILL